MITGSTANDIGTEVPIRKPSTLEQYKAIAASSYGSPEELLAYFPASDDKQARAQAEQIAENSGFALSSRAWAKAQTATGKQRRTSTCSLVLTHSAPALRCRDLAPATSGAYHTSDVPYWLGTYECFDLLRHTRDWTAWDRELSSDMQDVIVAFAKTGSPSTQNVRFVRYDPAAESRVVVGNSVKLRSWIAKRWTFLPAIYHRRRPADSAGMMVLLGPPRSIRYHPID